MDNNRLALELGRMQDIRLELDRIQNIRLASYLFCRISGQAEYNFFSIEGRLPDIKKSRKIFNELRKHCGLTCVEPEGSVFVHELLAGQPLHLVLVQHALQTKYDL